MLALARRLDGRSIKTSKQSKITATLVPNDAQKHSGIVLRKVSRSGRTISSPSVESIAVDHFNSTREIVAEDTSKR